MDSNSVSPMPELAPIAEFDKSPPSPPNEEVPMDDLPPPPATISQPEGKTKLDAITRHVQRISEVEIEAIQAARVPRRYSIFK
ncbi:unnamed protein product [Plutella xylostella]|uniref:(diamondback moth) hypothetical protein n=1 Tax=Plutella xylostella TaxID=51655 RepID=A0A8S4EG04_PLUXY|nr:unnamed protein product [Plutella xylostella]